jgi:hypothetical protein
LRVLPSTASHERTAPAGAALPISVVIPAYNRQELIVRALRSVAAQTRPPAEVIVVDDCSQDDTGAVAEAMGARVIRHEHNRGEAGARNSGLRAATQPWIATLDSDDEWLPTHLQDAWEARGDHVLTATSGIQVAEGAGVLRVRGALRGRPLVLHDPGLLLWPYNLVTASGVVVRRDAALAVGGYPEGIRYAADLEFLASVLSQGSIVVSPRIGVVWHVHEGQVSGDLAPMQGGHLDVIHRHRVSGNLPASLEDRWLGGAAWDAFRAARWAGDRAGARRALREMLAGPQRAIGVAGVLASRLECRRAAARVAPDGRPTVAVWRLAGLPAGERAALAERSVRELGGRGLLAGVASLVRRPPGELVATTWWQAAVARLAGIPTRRSAAT